MLSTGTTSHRRNTSMIFRNRQYIIAILLATCAVLETLALTYMQDHGRLFYYSSSLLFFFAGISICIVPLIPVGAGGESMNIRKWLSPYVPVLSALFLLFLIGYSLMILVPLYKSVGLQWADMLPTIKLACERFMSGKKVYGPAPEISDGSIIPYLPMMWIPFLPSLMIGFDLRWITFVFQFTGLAIAFIPIFNHKKSIPFIPIAIAGLGLFLLTNFFLIKNTTYWSMTEEGVVCGFYLFLSFALLRGNFVLIGLAIAGCVLSRYSLILWVPVYLVYVYFSCRRSDFWKLFLSLSVAMMVLFILPFFIKDPMYFINIPATYNRYTFIFWEKFGLNAHRYYLVGFFKFFTADQIQTMLYLQVATSLCAPVVFLMVVRWIKRKYKVNERYVAWGSLKISLVFFYSFVQGPFAYIYVPLTLISYLLVLDYLVQPDGDDVAPVEVH